MTNALVGLGANVCERSQLDQVFKEKVDQQSGLFSNESIAEIATGLGAKSVLLGTITPVESKTVRLNLKLVDVATYRILSSVSGNVEVGMAASAAGKSTEMRESSSTGLDFHDTFLTFRAGTGDMLYGVSKNAHQESSFLVAGEIESTPHPFFSSMFSLQYHYLNYDRISEYSYWYSHESGAVNALQLSWTPMLRVPLQHFVPIINRATDMHVGYSLGVTGDMLRRHSVDGRSNSFGAGVCSSLVAGVRVGITDFVSLVTDFRYYPSSANWVHLFSDGTTASGGRDLSGYLFTFGIGLSL